jgi:hypothetical protein
MLKIARFNLSIHLNGFVIKLNGIHTKPDKTIHLDEKILHLKMKRYGK